MSVKLLIAAVHITAQKVCINESVVIIVVLSIIVTTALLLSHCHKCIKQVQKGRNSTIKR